MKRILTIVACTAVLLVAGSSVSYAQCGSPVVNVMKKYDGKPGVESFNLGKFLIGIARVAAEDEGDEYLKYLDKLAIFDGEDASPEVKESMRKDLEKALKGYEAMIEINDEDDSFAIYCRMKNEDTIREMVMVEESDMAIILMGGRIPLSKIQEVAEDAME